MMRDVTVRDGAPQSGPHFVRPLTGCHSHIEIIAVPPCNGYIGKVALDAWQR